MMKRTSWGKTFKQLRKQNGKSLRQVEALSGVSNAAISQFENGKHDMCIEKVSALFAAIDRRLCFI